MSNAGTNASADKALLSQTGLSAPTVGHWFTVQNDGLTHIPLIISITGTATVAIEGRITSNDSATQITSATASTAVMVGRFPQMRVNVTAASGGATVRVSIGASRLLDTGA